MSNEFTDYLSLVPDLEVPGKRSIFPNPTAPILGIIYGKLANGNPLVEEERNYLKFVVAAYVELFALSSDYRTRVFDYLTNKTEEPLL
jgi:hypothetical protein